jgi:hypothetical protein
VFVDASGNVGVKGSTVITTSAASAPTFQIGDGAGSPALVMYSSTTGASQISFADATTGAASYDGYVLYSQNSQHLAIGTASTERLRLDSSGRLGLGTSSPTAKFESYFSSTNPSLSSNTGAGLSVYGTSTVRLNFGNYPASPYSSWVQSSDGIGNAWPIALNPLGGNVGIGTSSPAKLLHVQSGSVTGAARGGAFTKTLFESSDATATYWEFQAASTATNDFIFSKGNTGSYGIVGYDHVNDALRFFANGSERLRIDSSGRVGIGTSSPSYLLDLSGSASIGIRYKTTGTYAGIILDNSSTTGGGYVTAYQNGTQKALFGVSGVIEGSTTSDCGILAETGGNIRFYTNGSPSEKMRLDTSGRLGIGTTAPQRKLVISNSGAEGIEIGPGEASNINYELHYNRTTSAYIAKQTFASAHIFYSASAEVARLDTSGRLLVGTSSGTSVFDGITPQFQIEGTGYNSSSASLFANSNDANGAYLVFGKSRGTSTGSSTIVSSGDAIGGMYWVGADGTDRNTPAASIYAFVDGTPGSDDMPGRLVFSTTADGAAAPTERMRINNTGSVTLLGATSVASGTHSFQDNGSSPNTVRLYNNTDSNNTGNRFLICDAAASVLRAEIRSNGGLANFSANNVNLSDRNAKKDITLAIGTWDCLKEWEIVNFRYKDQPNDADLNLGVIAQQVAESCPEVITVFQEAKEATETEPAQEERLGVKDQQVMWMAIKALQEAMNRIEVLETEVAALKGA